jgi:hypothetical protein
VHLEGQKRVLSETRQLTEVRSALLYIVGSTDAASKSDGVTSSVNHFVTPLGKTPRESPVTYPFLCLFAWDNFYQ